MSKVDYLSNTINNFNEFIKIDEILENIKLHQIIEKTLFVLDSSLKTNNININKDFYKDEIFIVGNSTKLSQALLSIFNNSKDFLITNQIENKEIYIKTYVENSFIFIEIEDNAGGINKKI